MTQAQFLLIIGRLNNNWDPQWPVTEGQAAEWREELIKVSHASVDAAISSLRKTQEKRPNLALLLKTANSLRNQGALGASIPARKALVEGKPHEATPHQGISDLIGRLTKDKDADTRRKAADILKNGERQ